MKIFLNSNIKQAIKILNKYGTRTLVVLNKNNQVIGTLSDGNIRKSILKGHNLESSINDIYNNIVNNIILYSKNNVGIILCNNFHEIDNELLEIFYSYMQKIINTHYKIYFIIITDSITFIPDNIKNKCNKIYLNANTDKNEIDNTILYKHYYSLCDNIVSDITNKSNIKNFKQVRNNLYEPLIYNYNINNLFYDIMRLLISKNYIPKLEFKFIKQTFYFFYYYNNNYRPIFHLENYLLYLIKLVNGYK